jgi:hypothetical protein
MKILLGEVRRENISKPTIGNESLRPESNDDGIRLVNFLSEDLIIKSTKLHHNIHKCTWTSSDSRLFQACCFELILSKMALVQSPVGEEFLASIHGIGTNLAM